MEMAADSSLDLGSGQSVSMFFYMPDGYVNNPTGTNYLWSQANGGVGSDFRVTLTQLVCAITGQASTLNGVDTVGYKSFSMSWVTGNKASFYREGLYVGDGAIPAGPSAPGNNLVTLGSFFTNIRQIPSTFGAILATNRALTADEHYQVYEELRTMTWPNKTWSRNMGQLTIDPNQNGLVAGYDMIPVDGIVKDLSGNGNHGTINGSGFEFTEIGPSMKFDGVDDFIEIASDSSMDVTDDLTLSCWVKTTSTQGSLIAKWNTTGDQRSYALVMDGTSRLRLYLSSDGLGFESEFDDVSNTINDGIWKQVASVFTKANNTVQFYIDGVATESKIFTAETGGVYNSTSTIRLGDETGGGIGGFLEGSISQPKIITRALTQAEITEEYQADAKAVNWKSDYGVCESVAAETSGELSNSPFRIESGSFKLSTDTIGGDTCKVIECSATGLIQIPAAYFHGDETQAAYGAWEFWVNKKLDGTRLRVGFIGDNPVDPNDPQYSGYAFQFSSGEAVTLVEFSNGTPSTLNSTSNSFVQIDTWYKMKITRSSNGEFTIYLDDVIIPVTTGTNPVTDTSNTISRHIVLDFDTGDKVAYAAPNGDCSIVKYQGVV
jgi:hypothetical protein